MDYKIINIIITFYVNCLCDRMNNYQSPIFLKQRYPDFDQRYDLREQFQQIILLMESNINKLESLILKNPKEIDKILCLLKEMREFRVWSWKEADMDNAFYNAIIDFDKRTFQLIN